MDERLAAGRHHLDAGLAALRQGYLDDGRSHFEAALLQFRGPELRIGEAHALRGLGEVELHCGKVPAAESAIRLAILEYQEVRNLLDRVDTAGLSTEVRHDAEEGEAAAMVLLGDLLLRTGRAEEARQTLSYARELFGGLGGGASAAGLYLTLGRLGLREGRPAEARKALDKAVGLLEQSGDLAGQCGAWLQIAEVERLASRLDEASEALDRGLELARQTRQEALVARAQSARASLLVQLKRHLEALEAYDEALAKLRDVGDPEMEAYALLGRGDVRSRLADTGAVVDLAEAARLLGSLEHRHGLGAAMLRFSEHALRVGMPVYALAAAESARQFWQVTDPIRGVGMALRLQVKALAALKQWPAVVTVAHVRADKAGDLQPNALEVRDFYREKAPGGLLSDIDLMEGEQLELRAESMIEALLGPMLGQLDLDFQSLGVVGGALAVMSALVRATPGPAPQRWDFSEDDPPSIEQAPPDDDSMYAGLYAPPPFAEDEAPVTEEDLETEDADEYASLYTPPRPLSGGEE